MTHAPSCRVCRLPPTRACARSFEEARKMLPQSPISPYMLSLQEVRTGLIRLAAAFVLLATSADALWAQVPQASDPTGGVVGNAALPRDLSPWGMFLSADPVVKTVL